MKQPPAIVLAAVSALTAVVAALTLGVVTASTAQAASSNGRSWAAVSKS